MRPNSACRSRETNPEDQPRHPQTRQQQAHPEDIGLIAGGNAPVDDRRHHQRHQQLQRRLRQLQQRAENTLFCVGAHIAQQFFHGNSSGFPCYFDLYSISYSQR